MGGVDGVVEGVGKDAVLADAVQPESTFLKDAADELAVLIDKIQIM